MKTISACGLLLLVSISAALALGSHEVEGLVPMTAFFIIFGTTIALCQFIPGLKLFAGILRKNFFSATGKVSMPGRNK